MSASEFGSGYLTEHGQALRQNGWEQKAPDIYIRELLSFGIAETLQMADGIVRYHAHLAYFPTFWFTMGLEHRDGAFWITSIRGSEPITINERCDQFGERLHFKVYDEAEGISWTIPRPMSELEFGIEIVSPCPMFLDDPQGCIRPDRPHSFH